MKQELTIRTIRLLSLYWIDKWLDTNCDKLANEFINQQVEANIEKKIADYKLLTK